MKIVSKNFAFTLAETLITLGIIGIVAAFTIPVLYNSYQKTKYVATLKKAYSQFSQAIKLYIANEGVTDLSQTKLFTEDGDKDISSSSIRQNNLDKMVNNYFKTSKICKIGDSSCNIKERDLSDTSSMGVTVFSSSYYNFCTLDGICFELIISDFENCRPKQTKSDNIKGLCGSISIDINGSNPPNQFGRDFFYQLYITPDGNLYPEGGIAYAQYRDGDGGEHWPDSSDGEACGIPNSSVITNVEGYGCAARIIEEGWEMNY